DDIVVVVAVTLGGGMLAAGLGIGVADGDGLGIDGFVGVAGCAVEDGTDGAVLDGVGVAGQPDSAAFTVLIRSLIVTIPSQFMSPGQSGEHTWGLGAFALGQPLRAALTDRMISSTDT